MYLKLKLATLLTVVLFFLSACSDKVDSLLNKYEDVVGRYESKKDMTAKDIRTMRDEVNRIEEDFNLNVGKQPEGWKQSQRDRLMRLDTRKDKIEQAFFDAGNPIF